MACGCKVELLVIQNSVNWSELGQILVLDYVECIENFHLVISEKVYSIFGALHLLFQGNKKKIDTTNCLQTECVHIARKKCF